MLLCPGQTMKEARRSYLKIVRLGIDPDAPDEDSPWHPIHGGDDAAFRVDRHVVHVGLLGRRTDLERPTMEAAEFIRSVCDLAGFDLEQLASRARDRAAADALRLVVTLGVERWRQKRTALAAVLNRSPDVVSF